MPNHAPVHILTYFDWLQEVDLTTALITTIHRHTLIISFTTDPIHTEEEVEERYTVGIDRINSS